MNTDTTCEITSKWLKENTNISGWLAFLLFSITLGALASGIYPIVTYNPEDYDNLVILGVIDVFNGLAMLGTGLYTLYAFIQRKPNAVFWLRTYIIMVFVINLFTLELGAAEEGSIFNSERRMIRSLLWAVCWFVYSFTSKQVQSVIPKPFRRIYEYDWCALGVIVLIPIMLLIIGISQIYLKESSKFETAEMVIAENERTDGLMIFTVPDGFTCDSRHVESSGEDVTLFDIEGDGASGTMCSAYDTDTTTANFDIYWNAWTEDSFKENPMSDIDHGIKTINGNICKYRITKCLVNDVEVYWFFHLLFDEINGTVCLLSMYDTRDNPEYLDDLLKSIKFEW